MPAKKPRKKSKKKVSSKGNPSDITKKKRGRPAKIAEPIKRGPGRPPKVKVPEKPKRGRPAKKIPSSKPVKKRKGPGRPPKRGRPPLKASQKKKKVSKKRGTTQYHQMQYALWRYMKGRNIPVGKNFNKICSEVWKLVPAEDKKKKRNLRYWDDHIHPYYAKLLIDKPSPPPVNIESYKTFDYWYVADEMLIIDPEVNVIFQFEDDEDWSFEGSPDEFREWYISEMLPHLRKNYGYAKFTPVEAGPGYVNYTFKDIEPKLGGPPPSVSGQPNARPSGESEAVTLARIESEKQQRLAEIEARTSIEKQRMAYEELRRARAEGLISEEAYIKAILAK